MNSRKQTSKTRTLRYKGLIVQDTDNIEYSVYNDDIAYFLKYGTQ